MTSSDTRCCTCDAPDKLTALGDGNICRDCGLPIPAALEKECWRCEAGEHKSKHICEPSQPALEKEFKETEVDIEAHSHPASKSSEWEAEFEQEYAFLTEVYRGNNLSLMATMKEYIRALLTSAKAEERERVVDYIAKHASDSGDEYVEISHKHLEAARQIPD